MNFEIHTLPILNDNYSYIIRDEEVNYTCVIDPGEAAPIEAFLDEKGWSLNLIINTHHHHDHIDGNKDLMERYGCALAAPRKDMERIDGVSIPLSEGEQNLIVAGEVAQLIEVRGHTNAHLCVYLPGSRALFSGDALFSLGCGRVFEGSAEDMYQDLQKLKKLPDETRLYCGHEYTEGNGAFALSLGDDFYPESDLLHMRIQMVTQLRKKGRPSVPVALGMEKRINPFLIAPSAEEFAEIRQKKDMF